MPEYLAPGVYVEETSFRERARMFALPRSSWADYDTRLISTGGGIFPRTTKHR